MRKIYFALAAFLITAMAFSQGVTTASIGGRITKTADEPLLALLLLQCMFHLGPVMVPQQILDGYYRIGGMRTGGPYTISIWLQWI